jgi:hypothetical protein
MDVGYKGVDDDLGGSTPKGKAVLELFQMKIRYVDV